MFNGSSPRGFFEATREGHFWGRAKHSRKNFRGFSKLLVKIST